jgi:hypothetical protein
MKDAAPPDLKAIEKNEKKLRERFLGEQVRERQVWPWLEE